MTDLLHIIHEGAAAAASFLQPIVNLTASILHGHRAAGAKIETAQ